MLVKLCPEVLLISQTVVESEVLPLPTVMPVVEAQVLPTNVQVTELLFPSTAVTEAPLRLLLSMVSDTDKAATIAPSLAEAPVITLARTVAALNKHTASPNNFVLVFTRNPPECLERNGTGTTNLSARGRSQKTTIAGYTTEYT